MHWVYLLVAGLFEIGWILSLKFTEGFTRWVPMISYALSGFGAAFFLSLALKYMPMGITYAIWVGIGITGSYLFSISLLGEPFKPTRVLFILMIIGGIIGLKVSSLD